MKNKIFISLVSVFVIGFTSCQNDPDNLRVYEGDAGVYFVNNNPTDTLKYSFNSTTENYINITLPVETLGLPVSKDRKYSVAVIPSETTAKAGVDFSELKPEYDVLADSCLSAVTFKLLYTDKLDNEVVALGLELKTNGEFPNIIKKKSKLILKWTNQLIVPVPIEGEFGWSWWYGRFFGPYSKIKHRYILSVLHLKELPDKYETDIMPYYGMIMNNYFQDHEVYDENGQLIKPWKQN